MKIINRKILMGVDFNHLESRANDLVSGLVAYFVSIAYSGWVLSVS